MKQAPSNAEAEHPSSGIFRGVDDIIDEQLALILGTEVWKISRAQPAHHCKEICRLFRNLPKDGDLSALVEAIFGKIAGNYYRAGGLGAQRSEQNWRCEAQLDMDEENPSPEVRLERKIARLGKGWINQIPVASGFVGSRNRKNCIDLGWRPSQEQIVFVELKWNADNPLFAAFEVLKYGLAYLFARQFLWDRFNANYWMKDIRTACLAVLAPISFYEMLPKPGCDWVESNLNKAIGNFAPAQLNNPVKMNFCFLELPSSFTSECIDDAGAVERAVGQVEGTLLRRCS